jgi:hypothetical protein
MKTSPASLLLVISLFSNAAAQFRSNKDCPANEEALEFRFFTDAQSFLENGWNLSCDYADGTSETVWDVPPGTLKYTATTQVIRESTCVAPTTSCWLTIIDLEGDGLLSEHKSNGFAGWFALLHGARTVAVYSNEPSPAFDQLQYCVGPKCDQQPQEVTGASECETVHLALQLDARPQDTSYTLHCDGKTVWMKQWFTEPGAYVEEEACVASTSCCSFTIKDADTQGLTAAHNDQPGFVYLEWNFEGLLEYDGVEGAEFDTHTVEFGHGCGSNGEAWQDEVDFPVEDVNDSASYAEYGPVYGRPIGEDELDLFNDQQTTRGLSDITKIILFSLAGLILLCCLVVGLFYRRAVQQADHAEKIKDVPLKAGNTEDDDFNSSKRSGLASKDAHAKPEVPLGIKDDDSDIDCSNPGFV